jgi:hypothetical protein
MKPCAKNKKLITWLALDALDDQQAQTLREHLTACPGCRRYLEEISSVTNKLAEAQVPTFQSSPSFHQKVASRLRVQTPDSIWKVMLTQLRATMLDWRVALPTLAVVVAAYVMLNAGRQPPDDFLRLQPKTTAAPATELDIDLPPTIANYQTIANQSVERLDVLLTEQGNQNLSQVQVYTASILSRARLTVLRNATIDGN